MPIKHVFVLMMENRSFDHMLGFSGITGTDAETGQPTTIDGLKGTESNRVRDPVTLQEHTHTVATGAADRMDPGPGHGFDHVLEQLCGEGVRYPIGAPNAAGDPAGFAFNGTQSVVYRGVDNHIHQLWWDAQDGWGRGDLTAVTGAQVAAGDPAGFAFNGTQSVVYRGVDNHIHQLWWDAQNGWGRGDLTAVTGAQVAAGDPAGFAFTGTQSVVYRGVDNHIHQLWWDAQNGWGRGDLTAVTGAQVAAGDPAGFAFTGTQSVVYRGVDNHIHQLWWDAQNGWGRGDLTAVTGAQVAAGDPAGYAFNGTQHVVYRGSDNHIHELWWDAQNGWGRGDLTAVTGAQVAAGDPAGYAFNGTQHVVYRGSDNHIHELWWDAQNGWRRGDLTAVTGAQVAAGDPAGYTFDGTQHVVYRGVDGHIYELWWNRRAGRPYLANWGRGDLTIATGGEYPKVTESNELGYASSYAKRRGKIRVQGVVLDGPPVGPEAAGNVMKCFSPEQLPVLNALAREFVICDNWFCSMPGPTEPNRMFMHAATSGSFDDSPEWWEIAGGEVVPRGGYKFRDGTVFDQLKNAAVKYRIYADDSFPVVAEFHGISVLDDIEDFEDLAEDLRDPSFDAGFVHIEPDYNTFNIGDGNSQHPHNRESVAAGERFIKVVYETIRNSPVWEKSLLIITWDEHGGFYDHVIPRSAPATGERGRKHGFTFKQLGPRVPTVVVSPLIPRNLIEHRLFDHTAIPATLRQVFALPPLGTRNGISGGVAHLVGPVARTDAPTRLPPAAISAVPFEPRPGPPLPTALISDEPDGTSAAQVHSAVVQHLQVAPAEQHAAILARARLLRTHADAFTYMEEVKQLVRTKRIEARPVHA